MTNGKQTKDAAGLINGDLADAQAELDLLAFRYISGDLSEQQSVDFEASLEMDVAACEAVARMMTVTDVVLAAGTAGYADSGMDAGLIKPVAVVSYDQGAIPTVNTTRPGTTGVAWRWWSLAVAAICVVASAVSFMPRPWRQNQLTVTSIYGVDQDELATGWLALHDGRPDATESEANGLNDVVDEFRLLAPFAFGRGTHSPDVPDWMMAALSEQANQPESGDDSDDSLDGSAMN